MSMDTNKLAAIKAKADFGAMTDPKTVLEMLDEIGRLSDENGALRHAVIFAAETFGKITSGDGSGHADLGRAVLCIAGGAISSPENP